LESILCAALNILEAEILFLCADCEKGLLFYAFWFVYVLKMLFLFFCPILARIVNMFSIVRLGLKLSLVLILGSLSIYLSCQNQLIILIIIYFKLVRTFPC
jgi:hypothetical protein